MKIMQKWRRQVDLLACKNCFLARLIEVEFLGVNREATLDGTIEQIRLGEYEHQVSLAVADAGLHGQRLAQPEKIVRAVADAYESSSQAAHDPVTTNAVHALFPDYKTRINMTVYSVYMSFLHIGIL